ncbi:WD40-repeat-containing domain protein [Suillus americanus]|nr:WD40-repeat-containing domain protein [Suillus americanus]
MSASDVEQDLGPEISMSCLPDECKISPSKYFVGHTDPITCVALDPDSKMIISGSYDRRIRFWDIGSGQASGEPLRGHKVSVSMVAVSPDGTMFVSGGGDGRILIWNATTRTLATEPIQAHWNRIDSISFSPNSASIASIAGAIIKIWDVGTAKLIMDIESPTSERQVAFSPEGGRIAAVSHIAPDEQTLRIWDVKTGKPAAVSPITGHTGGLLSVAWFPNGQRLVTASLDRTIRLWISETGCQVGHSLGGHAAWMANLVAVSSDGKLIVALCGDNSIRLWNAITLDQIKLVLHHVEPVLCVAISADIRFIVGGCGDKKVCLWNIESITHHKYNSKPLPTLGPENQQDLLPDSSHQNQSPMDLVYPEVQSSPEHTVSQAVIISHGPLPLKPPTTLKEDADPVASPAEHSHFRKWWRQPLNFWNARKQLSSPQRVAEIEPCPDQAEIITNQGQSPAQDVLDEFDRYVMNNIPIRLIYLPTMELVGRNFVKTHFQDRMKEITEDSIAESQARFKPPSTRERVIPTLVQPEVKYGILSHRWLDTGEPSYQDMTEKKLSGPSNVRHSSSNITSRLKEGYHALHISRSPGENEVQSPGYKKLQKCCEEARRLDLHFLWSDTCCIDKNSSAELDESIRSMFRWYQNSSICIAYLGGTTVIEDLRSEEWFMRGWTLQELLAPRKIKFFNKDWQRLTEQDDDKEEDTPLMTFLQEVTGIPETELIDFEPVPRYIDKRMTWAAQRKTTRAEDVAYSLMGLFDVSLQIAYGEGGERAFGRLIEAIMQAGGDSSVLNWAGKPAKHHASFALPASPASFVGHPDIVTIGRLDLMLTSRGLRIPLVVLPLEMTHKPEFDGRPIENPKFHCPHHDIGEVMIDSRGYRFSGIFKQYALGIFHYIPAEDSKNPGLPKQVAAYLLERSEAAVEEAPLLGMSRQYRSFEDGWRRVPTGFIYVELPGLPDFASLWYVDRACLETVYL